MEIILRDRRGVEDDADLKVPTTLRAIVEKVWPDHDLSDLPDTGFYYQTEVDGVRVVFEPHRSRILLTVSAVKTYHGRVTRRWVSFTRLGGQVARLDIAQLREKHTALIPLAKANADERVENSRISDAKRDHLNRMYAEAGLEANMNGNIHIREVRGIETYSVTYVSDNDLTSGVAIEIAKVIKTALDGINRS